MAKIHLEKIRDQLIHAVVHLQTAAENAHAAGDKRGHKELKELRDAVHKQREKYSRTAI